MSDDLIQRLRELMPHPSLEEQAMFPNDDDVLELHTLTEAVAELARLRAIVRDLAARPEPYNIEWAECQLCESERLINGQGDMATVHDPGCPWLRATQEAETPK